MSCWDHPSTTTTREICQSVSFIVSDLAVLPGSILQPDHSLGFYVDFNLLSRTIIAMG